MRYAFSGLGLLSLAVLTGCGSASGEVVQKVFGGEKVYKVIDAAPELTAHRLTEPANRTSDPTKYTEGEAVKVPADMATKIRKLLKSPTTYSFDSAKGCKPSYGVRLKFKSGNDVVDVDLCYQCGELAVTHNGKAVGGED